MNSEESFNHWFVVPMQCLQTVPNNDGSFITLATALFLYERYAVIKLKQRGIKATEKNIHKQIAIDFGINERTAEDF